MIGDAQLWGEGSNADRLERIIARAKQADRLERQLAIECEKRLRAELDLKRLEQAAPVAPVAKAEAKVKPVAAAAEPTGFDWRDVPNNVLKSDRRHDAYAEKLRRSVEAIQEYNAGRCSDEQFAITGSLLRQLTGTKPGKVKDWMLEHDSELSAYADELGHGSRQNVGKPEPREVIKWSEAAYGTYEW